MSDSAPITWFTENPLPLLLLGGIVLLVLFVFLMKTGRGVVLMAMAGVALMMGLAVLTDQLIVTERERVADVIYQAANAAQRNDTDQILSYIAPSAEQTKAEAQRWIGMGGSVKLDQVSISAMEVTMHRKDNPPTATADFRIYAHGDYHDRTFSSPGTYLGHATVKFERQGDKWLVTGVEHHP
ncbi:MAG TPA: hypothetical protein VGJ15_01600 [Pirellulales bacterium]|jgi:hypothetical protein